MTYINIRDIEGGKQVTVPLGPSNPKIEGVGGWEEINRPLRKAATEWTGQPLLKVTCELLFNGWATDESQQAEYNKLQEMAWARNDSRTRPTRVKISSPTISLGAGRDWVIADLQMGEGWRDSASRLLRQYATLVLWEYEAIDVVKKKKRKKAAKKRRYTVKRGDTLMKIAQKELGSSKKWRDLKKLNPSVRDPKNLRVGQKIVVGVVD